MNWLVAYLVPVMINPIPVVEIGEGTRKINVYQANEKTCIFEFADRNIPTDTLTFYEEIDCRDVAMKYRWRP